MNARPISEIMTKQVHRIDINDSLINARNLLDKYEIHHLPVTDEDKLVGMLSSNDLRQVQYLCDFIGEKLEESTVFKSLSIEELMTKNVKFLNANATTLEAAHVFSVSSFQSLPIMDDDELVGIVTTKDLFAFFLAD
ncbi:MAG: hypothetical protein Tsb0034_24400 [Ekhidna sp.]